MNTKFKQLQNLKNKRQALADSLPTYTLRHDPRVHQLQEMDVTIERMANDLGVKAW
jgi:hypothetical protein